jgi:hypothetical protein
MLHRVTVARLSTCLVALELFCSQRFNAQAETAVMTGDCWVNAKTGKIVPPSNYTPQGAHFNDPRDRSTASAGHLTFVRGADGTWVNAANGETVPPSNYTPQGAYFNDPRDRNTASAGHLTFVRVPCPPPDQPASVQTLPVLPFGFGFGLGVGRRDRGDDQFRK